MNYTEYVESVAADVEFVVTSEYREVLNAYSNFDEFYMAMDEHRNDIEQQTTDGPMYREDTLNAIGEGMWDSQLHNAMIDLTGGAALPCDPFAWDQLARFAVFGDAYDEGIKNAWNSRNYLVD